VKIKKEPTGSLKKMRRVKSLLIIINQKQDY
jgi:hypothetical protein